MKKIENGTNTDRVITSCNIFSWATFSAVNPIRFAGTWNAYSNSAIPQLASTAMNHGLLASSLRWPYQAKVMNTLLTHNSPIEIAIARMLESSAVGRVGILTCGALLGRFVGELLHRADQRTLTLVVIFPWLALREQAWRRPHRVFRRVEAATHLLPFQRHGNCCTFAGSRRQRRHGSRQAIVAQVVEENLPFALTLGH